MEVTRDAKVSTLEVTRGLYSKKGIININGGDFNLDENRSGSILMVSGLATNCTVTMPNYASVGTNYDFLFNSTHGNLTLNFNNDTIRGTIYNISGGPFKAYHDVKRQSALGTKILFTNDASGKYTELECLKVTYDSVTPTKNEWFIRGTTDNLRRVHFYK